MIASARMTGAEFDALPYEEGRRWELVEGELVEVATANAQHQRIVLYLGAKLLNYFLQENTGGVYPDVEFAVTPNLRLCPDLAILFGDKWRALDERVNPLPLSPDIAVEVISPSERTVESARKVRVYLREGAAEVWQVFPETSDILIYRPGLSITVFGGAQVFETPLLPGWSLPLSELFPA